MPEILRSLSDKVRPEHTALVVVDVQNDFCADRGFYSRLGLELAEIQAMVPRLQGLIDAARQAGIMRVFVQAIYDEAFLSGPALERRERNGVTVPCCLSGTWGAEFYHIGPAEGEYVVRKHRYSAFINTDLDLILRSRGIKTLLLTGVATNVCVESTARDGHMLDYYVVVVEDCVASAKKDLHQATLENIRLYFGEVVPARDVTAAWAAGSGRGR
ncbi:MAG: cysteine hydrolase [Deltaproteobacteria bacterium]|nr:cysteine hydrolase [Deltaproteobacteria bacterium]MBI3076295.1 cysteine hydrolase [Deltaproteobacteria bacterium]